MEADAVVLLIDILLQFGCSPIVDIGHFEWSKHISVQEKKFLSLGDYVSYGDIPKRCKLDAMDEMPMGLSCFYSKIKALESMKGISYCDYIFCNQGMLSALGYYDGITVEVYVPDIRYPIASGGRYNLLLHEFELPYTGVGMNIDLDALVRVL